MKFLRRIFGLKNSTDSTKAPHQNIHHDAMFKLCEGIVGDTARVFTELECNYPINTVELMVFGAFIVSETYILATKGSFATSGILDEFHRHMANRFFNEHIVKENPEMSVEMCFQFHEQLHSLMVTRYPEYRTALSQDLRTTNTIFRKTVESLLRHIMASPLNAKDSEKMLIPLAIKVASFYTGCLSSFKEIV